MTRIAGVSAKEAGLGTKVGFFFSRRAMKKLTGREPEGILEADQIMAHSPAVLNAHGKLEQAHAKVNRLDKRYRGLAEAKATALTNCEFCLDLGSQILRRWGFTDEELLAIPNYRTSPLFTDVEKLVMDYALGLTRTPAECSDKLFAELRKHFDEAELVELTHSIAMANFRGRFNRGLGIGAVGFSEGMVCALPETLPDTAPAPAPTPTTGR